MPLAYIGLAVTAVTFALYVMWYGKPLRALHFDKILIPIIFYFILYIAIVAVADLPGVLRDTKFNTWLFAFLSLGFVAFLTATAVRSARDPIRTLEGALYAGLLVLCVLQLTFYALGVEHAEKNNMPQIAKYISSLLFFDIYTNRMAFPLSSSMQYSATYPSLLLAMSLIRLFRGSIYKISAIISLIMLLMIDARGFFVAPIFAYLTFVFASKMPPSSAALVSVAIPAVPVLIYKIRDIAQPLIYLVFPERNRSAEMFSNRGYIWEQYFSHFGRFGDIEKLIGFGGYGQYTSRLSESFLKFLRISIRFRVHWLVCIILIFRH